MTSWPFRPHTKKKLDSIFYSGGRTLESKCGACAPPGAPEVVRETDKGESTWQRARELAPAHGERAPAPRGGSDARGRNHGSHIDSPARVFVSDESSPCGTRKLALRSPVRADFALVSSGRKVTGLRPSHTSQAENVGWSLSLQEWPLGQDPRCPGCVFHYSPHCYPRAPRAHARAHTPGYSSRRRVSPCGPPPLSTSVGITSSQ